MAHHGIHCSYIRQWYSDRTEWQHDRVQPKCSERNAYGFVARRYRLGLWHANRRDRYGPWSGQPWFRYLACKVRTVRVPLIGERFTLI
jgi:hypothetical protein